MQHRSQRRVAAPGCEDLETQPGDEARWATPGMPRDSLLAERYLHHEWLEAYPPLAQWRDGSSSPTLEGCMETGESGAGATPPTAPKGNSDVCGECMANEEVSSRCRHRETPEEEMDRVSSSGEEEVSLARVHADPGQPTRQQVEEHRDNHHLP